MKIKPVEQRNFSDESEKSTTIEMEHIEMKGREIEKYYTESYHVSPYV